MEPIAIVASVRADPAQLPAVPGFIASNFSPLVHRTLTDTVGKHGFVGRTPPGIVLASCFGDTVTTETASKNLAEGKHHNPLLFYQSVPTSIIGYTAREWGKECQVTCIAPNGNLLSAALDVSVVLLEDQQLDEVLVVCLELASGDRALRTAGVEGAGGFRTDRAIGLHLVKPSALMRTKVRAECYVSDMVLDQASRDECKKQVDRPDRYREILFEVFSMNGGEDRGTLPIRESAILYEASHTGRWNAVVLECDLPGEDNNDNAPDR